MTFKNHRVNVLTTSLITLIISYVSSNDTITYNKASPNELDPDHEHFNFREYLSKFSPSRVWEELDKKKKYEGLKLSDQDQLEIMYKALDQTDELYNFRIGTEAPESEESQDGRRQLDWPSTNGVNFANRKIDVHFNRNRIYDLMRRAIYQARNRMIVMQVYREKYYHSAVYKMGFLTNKADIACKTFVKVSFRALRTCVASHTATVMRSPLSEITEFHRRQLTLWLDAQLIAELIERNNALALEIMHNETFKDNVKGAFNKQFIL